MISKHNPSDANYRAIAALTCLLATLVCAGCSDGRPKRVPISGVVLIDGEPLTHGSILFIPETGRPGGGALDSEGRFSATSFELNDGLTPGKHRVQIRAIEMLNETTQRWHAPKKYAAAATSGIEVNIETAKDDLTIELEWGSGKPFVERQ